MTTERDSDKQIEPRLLSDAELDAVTGGDIGTHVSAYALLVRDEWYNGLLPPR